MNNIAIASTGGPASLFGLSITINEPWHHHWYLRWMLSGTVAGGKHIPNDLALKSVKSQWKPSKARAEEQNKQTDIEFEKFLQFSPCQNF